MLPRLVLLMFGCWAFSSESAFATPPNVVFILTDDQGAVDAGCYGSTDLVTPNIDALAARGVRFTQFYSAAPVCSPSRAGILTGRYPVRAGVPGNCASQPGEKGALPPEQVTIAEAFRGAGYATAHIGKWHLGYTPETLPLAQGFDHSFGHMGGCIDNWSHFFYWSGPNIHDLHRNGREVFHDGQYFPELMADEAITFIDRHREQPFFLYFAMNAPHYPYQGEAKWLERFKDLEYSRRLYAAFLASQDERIGRLLKHLDQTGLRENTIVVLQSDNGHSTEERAHWGGGSAGPYRGAKFSLFEGGIRLPAMISWPGQIPQGEVRNQVAHACDWFPTLTELCGVQLPETDIDGLSLTPVLKSADAPSPHKTLHWQVGNGPNAQWAVRHGDWKLIGNVQDTTVGNKPGAKAAERPPLFLSNIARDSAERTNLMDSNPDIVQQLQQLHTDETKRP
ncbi:sulfatase-like hydrolase/transferase [Planctellipticum variicoloris]|uniref:sulfatase-like hydrolase/transferase n=1 Tax=Planctellipticum variicoloris TaxID=3064265 RepID=UPI00301328E0|nr:sulfatase-like hydrolase/transferase [Planctomycetaceae bacterium SH412]